MNSRTIKKGGRGGKRSKAVAPKGPVSTLCHESLLMLYISALHFMTIYLLEKVFPRVVDFDDSIHDRNQTVVLVSRYYSGPVPANQSVP